MPAENACELRFSSCPSHLEAILDISGKMFLLPAFSPVTNTEISVLTVDELHSVFAATPGGFPLTWMLLLLLLRKLAHNPHYQLFQEYLFLFFSFSLLISVM